VTPCGLTVSYKIFGAAICLNFQFGRKIGVGKQVAVRRKERNPVAQAVDLFHLSFWCIRSGLLCILLFRRKQTLQSVDTKVTR
jgi:hypothetical protein